MIGCHIPFQCFLSELPQNACVTVKSRRVDLIRLPRITVAIGYNISLPGAAGSSVKEISANAATSAVINTGTNLS